MVKMTLFDGENMYQNLNVAMTSTSEGVLQVDKLCRECIYAFSENGCDISEPYSVLLEEIHIYIELTVKYSKFSTH